MKDWYKKQPKLFLRKNLFDFGRKTCRVLYKPALILISLQIIFISAYIFDNRIKVKAHIYPRISNFIKKEFFNLIGLSIDTFQLSDYKEYLSDIFRSSLSRKKLERIDLNLSFKDKQKLECMRLQNDNCSKDGWVRASLKSGEEVFNVKLKSKGDRDMHRLSFNKMSFKVDIRGEQRLFGMEEFSIQLPVIRNYTIEAVAANIMREEDIVAPRHFYIALYLNGEYLGVRHIEETVSKELIESSKRRYGPVFTKNPYNQKFELNDKKTWIKNNSDLDNQALTILESSWGNTEMFNKYFDIDKWTKYMAFLDLTMMIHGTVPKSVKYYLNPSSGLIEPVFFDGHNGGWYNNYRLSDALTPQDELLKWPDCTITCDLMPYYRMMFGTSQKVNLTFYEKYLKNLKKYSDKKFITKNLTDNWKYYWLPRGHIYREFSKKDNIFSFGVMPHIGGFEKLKKRFEIINNEIFISENTIPKHNFSKSNNILEIENIESRFPQIYSLFCSDTLLKKYILIKNAKQKIDFNKIKECDFNNIKFSLSDGPKKNFVANTSWSDKDLIDKLKSKNLSNIIPKQDLTEIKKPIQKKYIFSRDQNIINRNIYLENKDVYFEDISNICLKGSNILKISNSNINFGGTSENPFLISGCNDKGGTLIIENSEIRFNNVKFSNLSAPNLKLRLLYGGVNIINSKIIGNKIYIDKSQSEDAINFINSNIKIGEMIFKDIKSDGLDSDFSDFRIKKVTCENIGNDCVDFSYSKGRINSIEASKIKDKVISLGEASTLEVNNTIISNSEIGITAKDLSNLSIKEYNHQNVKVPIAAYIKKAELGKPIIIIDKINTTNYSKKFISSDSDLYVNNKKILGENSSNQVMEMLYGAIYGVKTQR